MGVICVPGERRAAGPDAGPRAGAGLSAAMLSVNVHLQVLSHNSRGLFPTHARHLRNAGPGMAGRRWNWIWRATACGRQDCAWRPGGRVGTATPAVTAWKWPAMPAGSVAEQKPLNPHGAVTVAANIYPLCGRTLNGHCRLDRRQLPESIAVARPDPEYPLTPWPSVGPTCVSWPWTERGVVALRGARVPGRRTIRPFI
jgi:hypothetical protein